MMLQKDYVKRGSKLPELMPLPWGIRQLPLACVVDRMWVQDSNKYCTLVSCRRRRHHHHHVVCLTTGPYTLPKPVLHRVRSSAFPFEFQVPLLSLRSTNSCLRVLPRLSVTSIFPAVTRFRSRFLRKMRGHQLPVLLFVWCRIFVSSLTLCNTSSFLTRPV
jgi:hypothetical protein